MQLSPYTAELWDTRSQLFHAQGYIQSSGLRALTRSATEPSVITGGETVEQLEVRAHPGHLTYPQRGAVICAAKLHAGAVSALSRVRTCGRLHAWLSSGARARDNAHAGTSSSHHACIKQHYAKCQGVRLHEACARATALQRLCSAQAEMEQHRHTHDAPGLVSLTVLNSRPPVVKVRSSGRSDPQGGLQTGPRLTVVQADSWRCLHALCCRGRPVAVS